MCPLEQNKKLAATFPGLVYTKEKHNCNTRSGRKNLLDIPLCQTFTYGTQSCQHQSMKDWNRFKKENSTENLTYPVVKNILKKNILASYQYFFTDYGLFFYYSICYRTYREGSVMFYLFFLFFLILFYFILFCFLFIYSGESSESSDYSCDFCQHNPEFEQLM